MNVTFLAANTYSSGASVNLVGSNQNVVAWAICLAGSAPTAPTYNGASFTSLGQISSVYGASFWLFYLPNPASGTNTLSLGGASEIILYTFSGQSLAAPYDTTSIVLSAATLINNITPTVNSGLILCGAVNGSGSSAMSAGSGQSYIQYALTGIFGVQSTSGSGVSVSTSWTPGSYNFSPRSTFSISLAPPISSNALFFAGD
jgi:hypothetical protein